MNERTAARENVFFLLNVCVPVFQTVFSQKNLALEKPQKLAAAKTLICLSN